MRYGVFLDGRRFSPTHLAGDAKEICDVRARHMRHTAVGAWIKLWWHWFEPRGADSLRDYREPDSLLLQIFDVDGYERCIGGIL